MKFDLYVEPHKPVIVMLTGSFCPGECLEYIYSQMCDEYRVIVPTYNGLYEDSNAFTTREKEAREIANYLLNNDILSVRMIYGQSMGSEIGAELVRQLANMNVEVEYTFYDGAPMISLSPLYKAFMYAKFCSMVRLFKNKNIDEAMNTRFLKQLGGKKINSMKPMIKSLVTVTPFLTKQTIKAQVECCYTFDFPEIDEITQKHMYFFYGSDEKAYKTCYKGVKKAYPHANYRVECGHGHMTYSIENSKEYVRLLKEICQGITRY